MKTNIAETTNKEIQDIIDKLLENENYKQEDEAALKVKTPFQMNPDGNTFERKKNAFLALYPELLTYYTEKTWKTVPWICVKLDVLNHENIGERDHREMVQWLVKELTDAGYKPFHDEDAFAGYANIVKWEDRTTIKMYINPDFPEGYWSNHTL